MAKRPREVNDHHQQPPSKRQHRHQKDHHQQNQDLSTPSNQQHTANKSADYAAALQRLPPPRFPTPYSPLSAPAANVTFTDGIPDLPPVSEALAQAPFTHKSAVPYQRTGGRPDASYERLELLGDAYLELFASHLIFSRFSHLPSGQMSQLRELLVKNETLGEYALLYGFDQRVSLGAMDQMIADAKSKGNKGFNKVLGDMFEAYIAAIVMSDIGGHGVKTADEWVTALWSVKLLEQQARDRLLQTPPAPLVDPYNTGAGNTVLEDLRTIYNPEAKNELQRRIKSHDTVLAYEQDGPLEELKGAQLGQSRHLVALYLTGYGHSRKLLGKGVGKSKAEAGAWAAIEAMYGEQRHFIDECEAAMKLMKSKRAEEKAKEGKERAD